MDHRLAGEGDDHEFLEDEFDDEGLDSVILSSAADVLKSEAAKRAA